MAFTKQSFGVLVTTMTQWWSPTVVRVSGDKSLPKQLFKKADGSLECRFPKRLVMMANHQVRLLLADQTLANHDIQLYTDWLYLWWVAYTNNMHGYIYIILKESLKNVPIVGWGAQFYNFIFLSRKWEQDQAQFQAHLDQLNKAEDPMWLLIFPEGTNLAQGTRERSKEWAEKNGLQDMKHQLLPRSRGLQFCLQRLKQTTEWLYDCTIAYEGVPEGQYGQDIFTLRSSMFEGRPPKSVNMHFRRFKISNIPIDNDKAFEVWLRNRWREKDYLLEHFSRFNSFPEDNLWMVKQRRAGRNQLIAQPAKCIHTQIKSNSLEEFLSIFAPLTSVLMVVFLLSGGANPADMVHMLGDASQKSKGILGEIGKGLSFADISKSLPFGGASDLSNQVAGKAIAPNQATMSDIGRLTPAAAQKELIHKYLDSVRPIVARQVSLPEQALRKPKSNITKNKAPSVRSQPTNAVQSIATTKVPLRRAPASVASAPIVKVTPNSKLRIVQNSVSGAASQKNSTPIAKPASKAKPTGPVKTIAVSTATPQASANKTVVKDAPKVPGKDPKKQPLPKAVNVSPAMLAKMKGSAKPSEPKKVSVDPKILARIKAQKKS
jgi:1-acyl-sn-glycerol-3-phosphate acyltransferase